MDLLSALRANKNDSPLKGQIEVSDNASDLFEQLRGVESFSDALSDVVSDAIKSEKLPVDGDNDDALTFALKTSKTEAAKPSILGAISVEEGVLYPGSSPIARLPALRSGVDTGPAASSRPLDSALASNDRAQSSETRILRSTETPVLQEPYLAERALERPTQGLDKITAKGAEIRHSKENLSLKSRDPLYARRDATTSLIPEAAPWPSKDVQVAENAIESLRQENRPKIVLLNETVRQSENKSTKEYTKPTLPSAVEKGEYSAPKPGDSLPSKTLNEPRKLAEAKAIASFPAIIPSETREVLSLGSKADSASLRAQSNTKVATTEPETAKITPHADFEELQHSKNDKNALESRLLMSARSAPNMKSNSSSNYIPFTAENNPVATRGDGPIESINNQPQKPRRDNFEGLIVQKNKSAEASLQPARIDLQTFGQSISRFVDLREKQEILSDIVHGSGDDSLRPLNKALQARTTTPSPPPSTHAIFVKNLDALVGAVANGAPGEVEISLSPEDLGRLRFRMTIQESGLIIHVAADRPETAEIIRKNASTLEDALGGEGFETVDFHFEQDRQPTGVAWEHETNNQQEEARAEIGSVVEGRLSDRVLDLKV